MNSRAKIAEGIMTNTIEQSRIVNESEIRMLAYQMWEKAGHPTSQELQFWLDAETQLREAAKAAPVRTTAHLAPVDSKNHPAYKSASNEKLEHRQANSSKPQQKAIRI